MKEPVTSIDLVKELRGLINLFVKKNHAIDNSTDCGNGIIDVKIQTKKIAQQLYRKGYEKKTQRRVAKEFLISNCQWMESPGRPGYPASLDFERRNPKSQVYHTALSIHAVLMAWTRLIEKENTKTFKDQGSKELQDKIEFMNDYYKLCKKHNLIINCNGKNCFDTSKSQKNDLYELESIIYNLHQLHNK